MTHDPYKPTPKKERREQLRRPLSKPALKEKIFVLAALTFAVFILLGILITGIKAAVAETSTVLVVGVVILALLALWSGSAAYRLLFLVGILVLILLLLILFLGTLSFGLQYAVIAIGLFLIFIILIGIMIFLFDTMIEKD